MATGTGSFFKGTSQDQDIRFKNKEKKLIQSIKWPEEFDHPVDLSKVELGAIKSWIKARITELLGFEDELVINLAISQLEQADINTPLCPKKMQINLTGFLEDNAAIFMKELWNLLLASQESEGGIAPDLIQAKKAELLRRKEEIEKKKAMMQKLRQVIKGGKPEEPDKEKKLERSESPRRDERKESHGRRHEERSKKHSSHHSKRRHHHSRRHRDSSSESGSERSRSRGRRERSKERKTREVNENERLEAELRQLAMESIKAKQKK